MRTLRIKSRILRLFAVCEEDTYVIFVVAGKKWVVRSKRRTSKVRTSVTCSALSKKQGKMLNSCMKRKVSPLSCCQFSIVLNHNICATCFLPSSFWTSLYHNACTHVPGTASDTCWAIQPAAAAISGFKLPSRPWRWSSAVVS